MVTAFGYTLFCEGSDPLSLIAQAVAAEQAGFDFLVISDHYHPWLPSQKHAGFAWSILGAVAQATTHINLATMVTCPIMRYHPAIVAQMAATMSIISHGRFTLGLGAGERLNEHITGQGWPAVTQRHEMLREATEIIQTLWQGGYVSYQGAYFMVDDAQVFDLPETPIDMFIAAGGPRAATMAAELGAGMCMTEPDQHIVDTYKQTGGDGERVWGQIVLAWDPSEKGGEKAAYEQFRFSAGGWKVQSELPNPVNFEAATKNVRPEDLASSIPIGPDPAKHAKAIQAYIDCGVQHVAVAYPGDDYKSFMKFWQHRLRPALPKS